MSSKLKKSGRGKGRPKRGEQLNRIYLRESTFNLWRETKDHLNFKGNTDSEFAEILLHQAPARPRDVSEPASSVVSLKRPRDESTSLGKEPPLFASTPLKRTKKLPADSYVDITGSSPVDTSSTTISTESSESEMVLELEGTLAGDPFEKTRITHDDHFSDDHFSDDNYEADDFIEPSFSRILGKLVVDSREDSEDSEDSETNESSEGEMEINLSFGFGEGLPDNSVLIDDEATVTMVEPEVDLTDYHEETVLAEEREGQHETHTYPVPMGDNLSSLGVQLQDGLQKLLNSSTELLGDELNLCSAERAIVSVESVKELMGKICHQCQQELTISHKYCGTVLQLEWNCTNHHYGSWESSRVLCMVAGRKVYVDNLQFCLALMFSGNNFEKVALLCKFLSLNCLSSSVYYRIHRQYSSQVVESFWKVVRETILELLKQEDGVGVCGDGRNDSPGFCARYCCYFLMEETTKILVDLEVVDKRETGGNSTTMEKLALSRIIQRLMEVVVFTDITTDASTSVIGLIRNLKEQHPQLSELFHDLDIWHKACKLTRSVSEASKLKGCKDLTQWIGPVRNHFWFCAQECKGDELTLKNMWLGVLHHVCGEHIWVDGECKHGPLTQTEEGNTYLMKDSKAMTALRKIVFDTKWLNSLKYYTRFKHTGALENFNSMLLKYAPKRNSFDYMNFIERVTLAVLDHNFHTFRGQAVTAEGKLKFAKRYNKRSKKWHAEPVKTEKTYPHVPYLMAKVFQARKADSRSMARSVPLPASHPRHISPTIALRESPALEEVIRQRITRYIVTSKESSSEGSAPTAK